MPIPGRSHIRKIILILLLCIMAGLIFTLYAFYDYYYSYEQSKGSIAYEREPYVEFFVQNANGTDIGPALDVSDSDQFLLRVGIMNSYGQDLNLSLVLGYANETQLPVVFLKEFGKNVSLNKGTKCEYDLTLDNGRYVFLDLYIQAHEGRTLTLQLVGLSGTLAHKEIELV
jgi:hypothetical protein